MKRRYRAIHSYITMAAMAMVSLSSHPCHLHTAAFSSTFPSSNAALLRHSSSSNDRRTFLSSFASIQKRIRRKHVTFGIQRRRQEQQQQQHYLNVESSAGILLKSTPNSYNEEEAEGEENFHPSSPSSWSNAAKYGDGKVIVLGRGPHAVVEEGVVLVAPSHEYNHMLRHAAVFIYSIGVDEYGDHVTRGVIIDHPTAFTMGEMGAVYGVLGNNILFRGGDKGNDSAMMLHSYGSIDTTTTPINPIGTTSGIYEGGIQAAMEAANEGNMDADLVKFFFNFVEFTQGELHDMLHHGTSDEVHVQDMWTSVRAPKELILSDDFERGEAWQYLRNQIRQQQQQQQQQVVKEEQESERSFE